MAGNRPRHSASCVGIAIKSSRIGSPASRRFSRDATVRIAPAHVFLGPRREKGAAAPPCQRSPAPASGGRSAAVFLLLLAAVWLLRGQQFSSGILFLLYTLVYFAGQFFLEFTRGDEAIYLGPWRLAQLLDVALVLAVSALLLWLWWSQRNAAEAPLEEAEEIEEIAEDPPAIPQQAGE